MKEVLLLNMPFVSISRPAIGISLLKARLAEEGIECDVAYPNLLFAEWAGWDTYNLIDEKIGLATFAGDWLFSRYLFGGKLDLRAYLNTLQFFLGNEEQYREILALGERIGPFLERCLKKLNIEKYRLVGFTTTFQQNLSSLALAYAIKKAHPEKIIVFGGGNCEGIMGVQLHRSFPWIDYVCCGESEESFPELVKALGSGKTVEGIRGIVYRDQDRTIFTGPAPPIANLDRLPIPDYDDYFAALQDTSLGGQISPVIPLENSRGCWWGARSRCTFCGLNGEKIDFRSKSASRALEEIQFLKDRYRTGNFAAVDNIMDMRYFRDLLPQLRDRSLGVSIFYETRPSLREEQVKLLHEAGIKAIQPGIESLNTRVLRLMAKGTTAFQNIQLLKRCRQYGVSAAWNLLYGFPGERPEDYQETEALVEALYHLSPPCTAHSFRLDRFSPYFCHPESYGLEGIRPFAMYEMIYPLNSEEIFNLAYFFEFTYADGRRPQAYLENTLRKIQTWKESLGCDLTKHYGNDPELLITDTRPNRRQSHVALSGVQREVYDYCDTPKGFQRIWEFIGTRFAVSPELKTWLEEFLAQMVDWRFMVREKDQYLSLAIAKGSNNGD